MAGKYYHDKEDPSIGKKALWGLGEMLMLGGGIALLSFLSYDTRHIIMDGKTHINNINWFNYSMLLVMIILGLFLFFVGFFKKKTPEQLAEEATIEALMTPEEKEAKIKQRRFDKLCGDLYGLGSLFLAALLFWYAPNDPGLVETILFLPSVFGVLGIICNRTSIISWLATINSVVFIVLLFALYI